MKTTTYRKTMIGLTITALAACSSMGSSKEGSSSVSTQTMTGGAEGAPTEQGTPQPAGPKGSSSSGTQNESKGSSQGDASTGGAEGAQTPEAPSGGSAVTMPQR